MSLEFGRKWEFHVWFLWQIFWFFFQDSKQFGTPGLADTAEDVVKKHSQFIGYPVKLLVEAQEDDVHDRFSEFLKFEGEYEFDKAKEEFKEVLEELQVNVV